MAIQCLIAPSVRFDSANGITHRSGIHLAHRARREARFLVHRILGFRQWGLTEAKLAAIIIKVWFNGKTDAHILLKETLGSGLARVNAYSDTSSFCKTAHKSFLSDTENIPV